MKVNGKKAAAFQGSLLAYLEQAGYQTERIAVELNGCVVPRAAYKAVELKEDDVLEVVSFVGGG